MLSAPKRAANKHTVDKDTVQRRLALAAAASLAPPSREAHVDQHLLCLDVSMPGAAGSLQLQKGGRNHRSVLGTCGAAAAECWQHPAPLCSLRCRGNTVQMTKLKSTPSG